MTAKAPNVLIVMADQMAPAFLPIYGHPLTLAPSMEALAKSGVVFDSAYCNSPLCSPSRASFMSGLLPSRSRVYDNAAEFGARPDFRALPEASPAIEPSCRERCIFAGRTSCTGSKSG